MPPCPLTDILRRFLADDLSADQRRQVAGHVHPCPACQDALGQLTVAPPSTATGEADHEPALSSLLARLRQTVPARGTYSRLVRFPGPATPDAPLGQLGPYRILRLLGRGATSLVY